MTIAYNYTIASVDGDAKCMEVVYEAEGCPTMRISTRLPFVDETVEDVVKLYAPINLWEALTAPVIVPEVGVSGSITPVPVVPFIDTIPSSPIVVPVYEA